MLAFVAQNPVSEAPLPSLEGTTLPIPEAIVVELLKLEWAGRYSAMFAPSSRIVDGG
jgi:hypothetical protein